MKSDIVYLKLSRLLNFTMTENLYIDLVVDRRIKGVLPSNHYNFEFPDGDIYSRSMITSDSGLKYQLLLSKNFAGVE